MTGTEQVGSMVAFAVLAYAAFVWSDKGGRWATYGPQLRYHGVSVATQALARTVYVKVSQEEPLGPQRPDEAAENTGQGWADGGLEYWNAQDRRTAVALRVKTETWQITDIWPDALGVPQEVLASIELRAGVGTFKEEQDELAVEADRAPSDMEDCGISGEVIARPIWMEDPLGSYCPPPAAPVDEETLAFSLVEDFITEGKITALGAVGALVDGGPLNFWTYEDDANYELLCRCTAELTREAISA